MKSFVRLLGLGLAAFVVAMALMLVLPHDPYIRWQSVRTEAFARLGWVYERVHYDPTPVDVAFIGTSHTMNGINGAEVARTINAGRTGACVTVTNFAIPSYGRNMQWEVAHELLAQRKVKTLVIEVFENETRKAHPLFYTVAEAKDVAGAPLVVNLNYFKDVSRLPFRQAQLAVKSAMPAQFGLKPGFSLADYDGSDVDNTHVVNVGGVALTPPRDGFVSTEELARRAAEQKAAKNLNMMGKRFEEIEYRFPKLYLQRILDLAKANGAQVRFLYLPGYGKPEQPADMRPYAGLPMMYANDLLTVKSHWHDIDHMNSGGAALLSQRVGSMLAQAPELNEGRGANCTNGVAPRPSLKPFEKPSL